MTLNDYNNFTSNSLRRFQKIKTDGNFGILFSDIVNSTYAAEKLGEHPLAVVGARAKIVTAHLNALARKCAQAHHQQFCNLTCYQLSSCLLVSQHTCPLYKHQPRAIFWVRCVGLK
jgi:hypothetical protein